MKFFCRDYNGVCTEVIQKLKDRGQYTDQINDADGLVLWQDVRGECKRIAEIFKDLGKPVYVIQHGRGATRDYNPPNKFKLVADKLFVWGETELERMKKAGYTEEQVKVVGSPLFKSLAPKVSNPTKTVLFAPIIMEKEEPENIMVYSKLKEWESRTLARKVVKDYNFFKSGWGTQNITFLNPEDAPLVQAGTKKLEDVPHKKEVVRTIPYQSLHQDGMLVSKLTGIHDVEKYACKRVLTGQNSPDHIHRTVTLLRNTDVVVCIEDGTLPLLAMALDIPVIHVDIFKYQTYGGIDYSTVEKIKTDGTIHTKNINEIPNLVDYALGKGRNDKQRREKAIEVVEKELGPQYGDSAENILQEIENHYGSKENTTSVAARESS